MTATRFPRVIEGAMWLIVFVMTIALATGCSSIGPKNDKNAATAAWKRARAAVMITLAKDQYNAGNFDGARTTVNEAIVLVPDAAELRVLSARIAIEQGNLDMAENELRKAQELDPKSAAADYYYAVVMQRWQRTSRALELYTSACEKNPKEVAYVLARAETLVALDKESEAIQVLIAAETSFENSAEVRGSLGQVYLRQKRYAEACDALKQAVMLAADDESLREQLARSQYLSRRLPEAKENLERLVKSPKYAKRADLWNTLGEIELALDRPSEARGYFQTASELQPQSTEYLVNLARAALDSGDIRRAEITARKALGISPSDPASNMVMGYVRLQQDRAPEALAAFRRSAELAPTDSTPHCMAGMALEKLGRRDEAASEYATALKIKPDDDIARALLTQLQSVANVETNETAR
jgi:Flp pilus assembly protein TadD